MLFTFLRRFRAGSRCLILARLGEHAAPAVPSLIVSLRDREEEVRAAVLASVVLCVSPAVASSFTFGLLKVATALGQLGRAAAEVGGVHAI